MTLRARLLLIAAALALAVIGAGAAVWNISRDAQLRELDQRLDALLPIVAGLPSFGQMPPRQSTPPFPSQPISQRENPLTEAYIARVDTSGTRSVFGVAAQEQRNEPLIPAVTANENARDADYTTVGSVTGAGSWRATVVVASDGTTLLVAIPQTAVDASNRQVLIALGTGLGLVLIVVAIAGWWVSRLGLRPIGLITNAADQITAGDRTVRVAEQPGRTEASRLANAFNVMLDEHQATETRLRQFISDASHELRTPVASIHGFADLYRNGALTDDIQVADAMRRIGGESKRIGHLVDDMLLLARLDEGRALETEPVDIGRLLADAALDASATHPSRQIDIMVPERVHVVGDEPRLRQVVANLVTNALVHAPGATVTLSAMLDRPHRRCLVTVVDNGPGFAGASRAFDRFWRGDQSRQRNSGGSGLGLSIVRAVIDAHGGEVRIDSEPGRGTSVVVLLPTVKSPVTDD